MTVAVPLRTASGLRLSVNIGPDVGLLEFTAIQVNFRHLLIAVSRYVSLSNDQLAISYVKALQSSDASVEDLTQARLYLVGQRESRSLASPIEKLMRVSSSLYANPWSEVIHFATTHRDDMQDLAVAGALTALTLSNRLLNLWLRLRTFPQEIEARRAALLREASSDADEEVMRIARILKQRQDDVATEYLRAAADGVLTSLAVLPDLRSVVDVREVGDQEIDEIGRITRRGIEETETVG